MVALIKATHVVCPAEPTPDEIMYLNACDQIKNIAHSPTIYFYQHSHELESANVVSILKNSLSKALVLFYPLAGRLHWAEEGGSRFALHCNGKGVPIFESVSDLKIEDFDDFTTSPSIGALIPSVDYTTPIDEIPLVLVQVTRFKHGGISIGLGISHVMADGPSAVHFVKEWAKFARGVESPILDRSVCETDHRELEREDPSVLRRRGALIGEGDSLEQEKKPIDVAFLNLTKLQIEELRNKANMDFSDEENKGQRGYSRFEAVAAHIWRCTSKARGHIPEQQMSLHFPADYRNRLKPPLPSNYFGNAVIRVETTDTSGSLLSNSIGSAAKKIREALGKVTDNRVRGYLNLLKGLPDVGPFRSIDVNGRPKGDFYGNPNLLITSWTSLPLFETDFGWGNEIHGSWTDGI